MSGPMLFGKYCLLERISVGGMAEVFRAKPLHSSGSSKHLALKRILPHLAEDEEFITMFEDEAELTVQLNHPNIVQTYELGRFQSSYYILMEFIPGQDILSLQKRLRRERKIMSVAQACFIAREIAEGLHYAHNVRDENGEPMNIIHRDVSPQNVLIKYGGDVKVIDFGIAKAAIQRTKTQVGVLKGKFGYMSPEQVRNEPIDHRSDLFSIGTLLWEMLTNRRLFKGDNEFETLQAVKHPDVPPPSEKNNRVPPEVDRIVMKALAPDLDERYQTCQILADELDAFLQNLEHPYTAEEMSDWMARTFSEELDHEREKRQTFKKIQTPEDVERFQDDEDDEEQQTEAQPEHQGGLDDEKKQIWDPDYAPDDDEEVDPEEFGANHTVVRAGGFDPERFAEEKEDDVIALGEDDIVDPVQEIPAASSTPSNVQAQSAPQHSQQAQQQNAQQARAAQQRAQQPRQTGTSPAAQPRQTKGEKKSGHALRSIFAAAAVLVVIGLGYTAFTMAFGEAGFAGPTPKSTLIVGVTPPVEAEIRVDGEERGTIPPVAVADISAGEHTIELRHPAYEPVTKTINVEGGGVQPVEIELSPQAATAAQLRLRFDEALTNGEGLPEDAAIFVDGESVESQRAVDGLKLDEGRHLIEVVSPGHKAWARVLEFDAGEIATETVELEPQTLTLELDASETAEVRLDGRSVGTTPTTLAELDPSAIHTLDVQSEESRRRDWNSSVGFPRVGTGAWTIDLSDPPEELDEDDFGTLEVSTKGDWSEVYVDGVRTGLHTADGEIDVPVVAGAHTVSLQRGRQSHEVEVDVEGGQTTDVEEDFTFEWKNN